MPEPLNILILHRLGDPCTWRESMVDKELCLPKFAPHHRYVAHDFWLPLPAYVTDIAFDAVILTQTFLGARRDPTMRARVESVYAPLIKEVGFKIALPQDDYTCSAILDRWMVDWDVDLVYPVCVNDWPVLYPRYSRTGSFRQGFTGYINTDIIARTARRKPIDERTLDVAYRAARHMTGVTGRLGQIKNEFGERFARATAATQLRVDVSTDPKDTILGTKWYDFIESTRCMLSVNSGSSLLDPDGLIDERIFRYLQRHPNARFEDVEAACFPGEEGRYSFTAVSPRNLECALFGTVQILTPGEYGGLIRPWEHYIPLDPGMVNLTEVLPAITDHSYLQAMADRCREAILSYPELRYPHHVQELIETIAAQTRVLHAVRERSAPLIEGYQREIAALAPAFWRRQRLMGQARRTLGDLGLRRLKYLIKDLAEQRSAKRAL